MAFLLWGRAVVCWRPIGIRQGCLSPWRSDSRFPKSLFAPVCSEDYRQRRANKAASRNFLRRLAALKLTNRAMKKILQSSNQIPIWQKERALLLQKACIRVKARIARGGKLLRSVRLVARSMNGRTFKSDPGRTLKLSPKTLLPLYYKWRVNGESPAVFTLYYSSRHSLFTNLVIARLADVLLAHPNRSFKSTWNVFSSHRSNFKGRWRPAKKAVRAAMKKATEIESRVRAAQ